MIVAQRVIAKAGPAMGLPLFLLSIFVFFQSGVYLTAEEEEAVLTFQEIDSTCINRAHYDSKAKQLTVRFVDRDTDRFYRYSNVPAEVWRKIKELNGSRESVGNYFTTTVVQHPEKFPFEKIFIQRFKTIPVPKRQKLETRNKAQALENVGSNLLSRNL